MARASSGIGCGDAFQQKAKRKGKGEDELDERLAIVKQLKGGGFVLKIDCGGSVFACLCGGLAHVFPPGQMVVSVPARHGGDALKVQGHCDEFRIDH